MARQNLGQEDNLNLIDDDDLSFCWSIDDTFVSRLQFIVCFIYSLNLIEPPVNPLQQKQLERITATLTTIPILHNLFVSCNHLVAK